MNLLEVFVESNMISDVLFDEESGYLTVVFKNGRPYCYKDVPIETYNGLMGAESKGKFMTANVIGKFQYSRGPCPMRTDSGT